MGHTFLTLPYNKLSFINLLHLTLILFIVYNLISPNFNSVKQVKVMQGNTKLFNSSQ